MAVVLPRLAAREPMRSSTKMWLGGRGGLKAARSRGEPGPGLGLPFLSLCFLLLLLFLLLLPLLLPLLLLLMFFFPFLRLPCCASSQSSCSWRRATAAVTEAASASTRPGAACPSIA